MEVKHSKLPWALNKKEIPPIIYADPRDGSGEPCIAILDGDAAAFAFPDVATCEANAAFIVRACNAHDDLVTALQLFVEYDSKGHDDGVEMMLLYADAINAAKAALAKAGVTA